MRRHIDRGFYMNGCTEQGDATPFGSVELVLCERIKYVCYCRYKPNQDRYGVDLSQTSVISRRKISGKFRF